MLTAVALTTGVGAAAHADPPQLQFPTVGLSLPPEVNLAAGGEVSRIVRGSVHLAHVTNPQIVFSVTAMSKVASLTFPSGCTTSGSPIITVTCTFPNTTAPVTRDFELMVEPLAGVAAPASASMTATVKADNYGPSTTEVLKVSLHDGVDMLMKEFDADDKEFTPTQVADVSPAIFNVGNKAAVGIKLQFFLPQGVSPVEQYEGCVHHTGAHARLDCVFPDTIQPLNGIQYLGAQFKLAADAMGYKGIWVTGEAVDEQDPEDAALLKAARTAGGRTLKARPLQGVGAKAASEINPDDNGAEFRMSVKNTYDMQALGSTANGKVGDVVKVSFGARNNGPGSIDISRSGGEPSWRYYLTLPPGTKAVAVPAACVGIVKEGDSFVDKDTLDATIFGCKAEPDFFPVNSSSTRELSLKITQVIANATGPVSFNYPDSEFPRPADRVPTNDTASVIINPSGGLPLTGAKTGPMLAAGGALLAIGTGLFLVARRRRVVLVTPES